MALRSTTDRYGTLPAAIHWLTALAIVLLLASGQTMSLSDGLVATILPVHVSLGLLVGVLTLFRILWWVAFDRHPAPQAGMSRAQENLAKLVHTGLYAAILIMVASGVGMLALTGAFPLVFSGGPLPQLTAVPPFQAHSLISKLLFVLALGHIAAALYHQLVKRDGLIGRMGFGGNPSSR